MLSMLLNCHGPPVGMRLCASLRAPADLRRCNRTARVVSAPGSGVNSVENVTRVTRRWKKQLPAAAIAFSNCGGASS